MYVLMSLGWDGPEVLVSDERGPGSILLGRAREERSVMPCTPEDSLSTWVTRREKGSVGQWRLPAPASQNNRFGSKEIAMASVGCPACRELSRLKVGAFVLSTWPQILRDHLV